MLNGVSELRFSLPADDGDNAHCAYFNLARYGDYGLYRIMEKETTLEEASGVMITSYSCEHVITMLLNDSFFGTFKAEALQTKAVLQKVLDNQKTRNWMMGDCEISRGFWYSWRNEKNMTMFLNVPTVFDQSYQWEYDTSGYPWVAHLRVLDESKEPEFYVRREKNLRSFVHTGSVRNFANRIYPLGNGEGDDNINRTLVSRVNGGKPYVEAANWQQRAPYLIDGIWEDRRYTVAENLLAAAKVMVEKLSRPYETIVIDIADLSTVTGEDIDTPRVGKIVQFEDVKSYIIRYEMHHDQPEANRIELANAPEDVASSIADYAERLRFNSIYATGAPNTWQVSKEKNADSRHPLTLTFNLPNKNVVNLNEVLFEYSFSKFRANSVGVEDGGGSTITSQSNQQQTSSTEGAVYTTTATDTQPTQTSGASSLQTTLPNTGGGLQGGLYTDSGYVDVVPNYHRHYVNINLPVPDHTHIMDHTHTISGYSHGHAITIGAHSHTIAGHSHLVLLPTHRHGVAYGIYEGPVASGGTITVDGTRVTVAQNTITDIAQYFKKDAQGMVTRGKHTITITPNGSTYIEATADIFAFIQSSGSSL